MKKFWKSEMGTDFVFSIFFLNSLHSKDAEKPLTTYLKLFLKKDTKSYFCPKYLYGALNHVIQTQTQICLSNIPEDRISMMGVQYPWAAYTTHVPAGLLGENDSLELYRLTP